MVVGAGCVRPPGLDSGMAATLAVIGGGNMGAGIVRGAVRAGVVQPGEVVFAEPDGAKRPELGVLGTVVADAGDAVGRLAPDSLVLLAIKPQVFPLVVPFLRGEVSGHLVLSVMAGVTLAQLGGSIGSEKRLARAMPNLASTVGLGVSALCAGPGTGEDDIARASALLGASGTVERVEEPMLDAITALSGSGPAYLFYLAEAMTRGGVDAGLPEGLADRIVRRTLLGAATMLANDAQATPGELRARVTSKGGTTAAACGVLDGAGVHGAFARAIVAGRDRARELSRIGSHPVG